jgi:hypothetical protein
VTTVSLTVISPINTLAAVTGQEYDSQSDTAFFEITTSVQWPYMLTTPSINDFPNEGFVIGINPGGNTCPSTPESPCTQIWNVNVTNIKSSYACNLDGPYVFDWTYDCRAGFVNCPVVDGSSIPSITANIISEDICGTIDIVSSITGGISSYSDDTLTVPQLAYIANEPMFFLIDITSDVNLQTATIESIIVIQSGVPTSVVSRGGQVSNSVGFTTFTENPSAVGFQFNAVYGDSDNGWVIFDSKTLEDVFTFTVQVDVAVSYDTSFSRKRDVLTKTVSFARELVLDPTNPRGFMLRDNAASVSTFAAGSFIAAAAAGVVALL